MTHNENLSFFVHNKWTSIRGVDLTHQIHLDCNKLKVVTLLLLWHYFGLEAPSNLNPKFFCVGTAQTAKKEEEISIRESCSSLERCSVRH